MCKQHCTKYGGNHEEPKDARSSQRAGTGDSAVAALSAQADYVGHSPEANQASYWETYFEGKGYTDVECMKIDKEMKSYTVDGEYIGVILKAGAGDQANKVFTDIAKDTNLTHPTGKDISHVITCTGTMPGTEEPGDDKPSEEPTKPVEEPTKPVEEPTKPVEEPSKPSKPAKPGVPKTGV